MLATRRRDDLHYKDSIMHSISLCLEASQWIQSDPVGRLGSLCGRVSFHKRRGHFVFSRPCSCPRVSGKAFRSYFLSLRQSCIELGERPLKCRNVAYERRNKRADGRTTARLHKRRWKRESNSVACFLSRQRLASFVVRRKKCDLRRYAWP